MIKRLILILVVTTICFQATAQSEFKPELNVGVGFGPTFSSMSIVPMNTNNTVKTKNALQYHGGVSIRYISEKHFGLIAEVNYAQMGWNGNFEEQPDPENPKDLKYRHTLNYIEIPLLTHIYFGSEKVRFFMNLGPKIGVLMGDKETLSDDLQSWIAEEPSTTDYYPTFAQYGKKPESKLDYGITAGLGMELRTKIGYFTIEGRYYMGFGDIYKSQKGQDFSRSANREISAKLTYYIKVF